MPNMLAARKACSRTHFFAGSGCSPAIDEHVLHSVGAEPDEEDSHEPGHHIEPHQLFAGSSEQAEDGEQHGREPHPLDHVRSLNTLVLSLPTGTSPTTSIGFVSSATMAPSFLRNVAFTVYLSGFGKK